jgi:Ca2+-binding EF-hand superfamily protein
MRGFLWGFGVAALVGMMGSGVAMAGGDVSGVGLRGPIPFEVFDLDGSGAISEEEFDQVRARRAEAREEAGLPPSRQSRPFSSLDGDGDGAIGREELQAAHGAGNAGAGQGRGTRGGRGMGRGVAPPVFSEFDLNGDGRIDEPEFAEARAARVSARAKEGRRLLGMTTAPPFAEFDSDGDGSLDPGEFAVAVERHWQGRGHGAPDAVEP